MQYQRLGTMGHHHQGDLPTNHHNSLDGPTLRLDDNCIQEMRPTHADSVNSGPGQSTHPSGGVYRSG